MPTRKVLVCRWVGCFLCKNSTKPEGTIEYKLQKPPICLSLLELDRVLLITYLNFFWYLGDLEVEEYAQ